MKSELTMPKLRPDMQQGVLVAWLKQPGEPFQKGDAIYEVESDKVVNQIEAEKLGRLCRQLVEEGDAVLVGDPIAEVE